MIGKIIACCNNCNSLIALTKSQAEQAYGYIECSKCNNIFFAADYLLKGVLNIEKTQIDLDNLGKIPVCTPVENTQNNNLDENVHTQSVDSNNNLHTNSLNDDKTNKINNIKHSYNAHSFRIDNLNNQPQDRKSYSKISIDKSDSILHFNESRSNHFNLHGKQRLDSHNNNQNNINVQYRYKKTRENHQANVNRINHGNNTRTNNHGTRTNIQSSVKQNQNRRFFTRSPSHNDNNSSYGNRPYSKNSKNQHNSSLDKYTRYRPDSWSKYLYEMNEDNRSDKRFRESLLMKKSIYKPNDYIHKNKDRHSYNHKSSINNLSIYDYEPTSWSKYLYKTKHQYKSCQPQKYDIDKPSIDDSFINPYQGEPSSEYNKNSYLHKLYEKEYSRESWDKYLYNTDNNERLDKRFRESLSAKRGLHPKIRSKDSDVDEIQKQRTYKQHVARQKTHLYKNKSSKSPIYDYQDIYKKSPSRDNLNISPQSGRFLDNGLYKATSWDDYIYKEDEDKKINQTNEYIGLNLNDEPSSYFYSQKDDNGLDVFQMLDDEELFTQENHPTVDKIYFSDIKQIQERKEKQKEIEKQDITQNDNKKEDVSSKTINNESIDDEITDVTTNSVDTDTDIIIGNIDSSNIDDNDVHESYTNKIDVEDPPDIQSIKSINTSDLSITSESETAYNNIEALKSIDQNNIKSDELTVSSLQYENERKDFYNEENHYGQTNNEQNENTVKREPENVGATQEQSAPNQDDGSVAPTKTSHFNEIINDIDNVSDSDLTKEDLSPYSKVNSDAEINAPLKPIGGFYHQDGDAKSPLNSVTEPIEPILPENKKKIIDEDDFPINRQNIYYRYAYSNKSKKEALYNEVWILLLTILILAFVSTLYFGSDLDEKYVKNDRQSIFSFIFRDKTYSDNL